MSPWLIYLIGVVVTGLIGLVWFYAAAEVSKARGEETVQEHYVMPGSTSYVDHYHTRSRPADAWGIPGWGLADPISGAISVGVIAAFWMITVPVLGIYVVGRGIGRGLGNSQVEHDRARRRRIAELKTRNAELEASLAEAHREIDDYLGARTE